MQLRLPHCVLNFCSLCLSLTHLLYSALTLGESGEKASQGRTSGWATFWMESWGRMKRMRKLASWAVIWKAPAVAQLKEKEGEMLFQGKGRKQEQEHSCGRWAWRDGEVRKPVPLHCLLGPFSLFPFFPWLSSSMAGTSLHPMGHQGRKSSSVKNLLTHT